MGKVSPPNSSDPFCKVIALRNVEMVAWQLLFQASYHADQRMLTRGCCVISSKNEIYSSSAVPPHPFKKFIIIHDPFNRSTYPFKKCNDYFREPFSRPQPAVQPSPWSVQKAYCILRNESKEISYIIVTVFEELFSQNSDLRIYKFYTSPVLFPV